MLGRTHLLSGLVVVSLFLVFNNFSYLLLLNSLFFLIGIMFPDIDKTTSFLGKRVKIVGFFSRHRGFFHSFFGLILFSLLIFIFNKSFALFFSLGYLTHLLEDMLTKQGICPFLLGIKIKGFIVVGSFTEKLIFYILFLILILLVFFFIF